MSRGTLCVKGWNGHQIIHHQQRLYHPLLKQNHSFKSVSWQKAIQTVATGLEDIKSRYGPDSIGVVGSIKCTNEANYVLGQFARAVIGTNNIDTSARFYQAPTMAALDKSLSPVAATASINDIEKTHAIFLIGCNVKDEMAAVGSLCLQAAHRGTACIEMDYVGHELSSFFSLNLQPFAERILWVINAMIHHILSSKLYDQSRKADLKDLVKKVEPFSPEQCEQISGIPARDIIKAAEIYATAEKSMILYGHGVTQSVNSTQTIRALWNLALLTGHETGEGKGILPLMISNNLQGSWDMGLLPDKLPGQLAIDNADHRKKFETAWDCILPETPGLTLTEMIDRIGKEIRALYIVGENLAWSAPDCKSVQKALEKLDFLVVQDLFLTDTANQADVVLPAASFAEKDGTHTSTESRLQRINRAIPPVGSAKPDYEIVTLLSGEMKKPLGFESPAEIFEHISQNVDRYKNIQFDRIGVKGGILLPKPIIKNSFLPALEIKEMTEPPDIEYPYILIVERMPFHRITGTQTNYSFTLSKELMEGGVYMNSREARDLNIRTGWPVKIKTRTGEVVRSVLTDPSIPHKTLLVPVHHKNGLTLELLSPRVEPNSKTPSRICAAKLEI